MTTVRRGALGFSLALILGASGQVAAAPLFFLSPGTNPAGDVAWQTAVGSFVEEDLDSFVNGAIVTSVVMGGVTVGFSLPSVGGSGVEIFAGAFAGGGGVYGTVSGNALLNRNASGGPDSQIQFTFSSPVRGFGLWVFDNTFGSADSFTMTANSVTSGVLDASPGSTAHTVEGFLGVYDPAGISSVTVTNTTGAIFFELDHLQVATVPEPASLALLGGGLIAMGACRRRRKEPAAPR
jgi:hypothetical protein